MINLGIFLQLGHLWLNCDAPWFLLASMIVLMLMVFHNLIKAVVPWWTSDMLEIGNIMMGSVCGVFQGLGCELGFRVVLASSYLNHWFLLGFAFLSHQWLIQHSSIPLPLLSHYLTCYVFLKHLCLLLGFLSGRHPSNGRVWGFIWYNVVLIFSALYRIRSIPPTLNCAMHNKYNVWR